jgi:uncharacterized membrane protein YadS
MEGRRSKGEFTPLLVAPEGDVQLVLADSGGAQLVAANGTVTAPISAPGTAGFKLTTCAAALLRDATSMAWVEDNAGLLAGFLCFALTTALAAGGVDLAAFQVVPTFNVAATGIAAAVIIGIHTLTSRAQQLPLYAMVILVAVCARAVGGTSVMASNGLNASFWAIVGGTLVNATRAIWAPNAATPQAAAPAAPPTKVKPVSPYKTSMNAEAFIKVGVILLATDFATFAEVGGQGLVVSWVDTLIVGAIGVLLGRYVCRCSWPHAVVVAGATAICGSSAATALASALGLPAGDAAAPAVIALIGILNAPLIVLMPRALSVMPAPQLGAWIGGSIDSTGPVIAAASMAGPATLRMATNIKMAQNVAIGPVCLAVSSIARGQVRLRELWDKFPRFVLGFLLTSAVVTLLPSGSPDGLKALSIANAFVLSEWMSLLGFVCIGLEFDVAQFRSSAAHQSFLVLYLLTQSLDLATTYGWARLLYPAASS